MSPAPPRGQLNEALDRLVSAERAHRETDDETWAGVREAAWRRAVWTVLDLEARGELGWLTPAQVAHYLQREGADARSFVIQYLVPRLPAEATDARD